MPSRTAGIIILAVLLLFGTGCAKRQETDSVAFILALGVDKAGQKKLKTTYQIAIAKELAGKQGGSDNDDVSVLTTIDALNLAESRNLLGSTMSRVPTASHMKAIIISEEMARQGLEPLLSPLMRFREYRGNIFLIVVRGSAEQFMLDNKPKFETVPSKYYEAVMFAAAEMGSYYLLTDLHDFHIRLKNRIGSPYIVYAGLTAKDGVNRPSRPSEAPEKVEEYLPGGMPHTGTDNEPEFIGTALFRGDKMVGSLTSEETRMMAILQGKFAHAFFVVQDPFVPKESVNLRVRLGEDTKTICEFGNGRAVYHVKVRLEGELSSIPSGINYEAGEYKKLLEKQIAMMVEDEIRKMLTKTQELETDPVGFTAYLRPHFKLHQEMRQADLLNIYKEAEFLLDVKMTIRRSGLIWRTSAVDKPKEGE